MVTMMYPFDWATVPRYVVNVILDVSEMVFLDVITI